MLAAASEDLTSAAAHLGRATEPGHPPLSAAGFPFRLLAATVFEARRPILAIETRPALRAFLDGVADARAPLAALREACVPAPGGVSPVEAAFAPAHNRAVHHPWPGSHELRDALEAAGDEPAGRFTRAGTTGAGDAASARELLASRLALAAQVAAACAELTTAALAAHLAAHGLDAASLIGEHRVGIG